jgi:hypothetical protein
MNHFLSFVRWPFAMVVSVGLFVAVGSAPAAVIIRSVSYELNAFASGRIFPFTTDTDSDVKVGFPTVFPFVDIARAQAGSTSEGFGDAAFEVITLPGGLLFKADGKGRGLEFSAGQFYAYGEGEAEFQIRFDVIGSTRVSSTIAGLYQKNGFLEDLSLGYAVQVSPFAPAVLPQGEYLFSMLVTGFGVGDTSFTFNSAGSGTFTITDSNITVIPEASSLAMSALGAAGLASVGLYRRRRAMLQA